jgi:hypothetical protein
MVMVPVVVSKLVETDVVVVERVSVDVVSVVTVEVATVLVAVTSSVEVDVTVTGTVVTVVTEIGPKPRMLPTAQPSVDDTIQTALIGFSMPVIGCAKTRVQVKPFQNRITGSPPGGDCWPTAQPSTDESM